MHRNAVLFGIISFMKTPEIERSFETLTFPPTILIPNDSDDSLINFTNLFSPLKNKKNLINKWFE